MTKKKSKSQSKPAAKKTPARKTKAIKSKGVKKTKEDCPDNVCPIKKKRVNESVTELSVYNPPVQPSWLDRIKSFFCG